MHNFAYVAILLLCGRRLFATTDEKDSPVRSDTTDDPVADTGNRIPVLIVTEHTTPLKLPTVAADDAHTATVVGNDLCVEVVDAGDSDESGALTNSADEKTESSEDEQLEDADSAEKVSTGANSSDECAPDADTGEQEDLTPFESAPSSPSSPSPEPVANLKGEDSETPPAETEHQEEGTEDDEFSSGQEHISEGTPDGDLGVQADDGSD